MATAEKQQQRNTPIKDEPLDDEKQDDFDDEYDDDYDDEYEDDFSDEDDQGQDTSGKAVQARQPPGQTISSKDKQPAAKEKKKDIDEQDGLKLKLDVNLDIEVDLKARIHGDLTLALLYVEPSCLQTALNYPPIMKKMNRT